VKPGRLLLDPKDIFIDTSKPTSPGPVLEIIKNGEPGNKVDLLVARPMVIHLRS